jgi:hypothetical protein
LAADSCFNDICHWRKMCWYVTCTSVWIKNLNINVYEMFYCLALLCIQEVLLGSYYRPRLPILTGFHVFFFSYSRQIPGQCLNLGHNHFHILFSLPCTIILLFNIVIKKVIKNINKQINIDLHALLHIVLQYFPLYFGTSMHCMFYEWFVENWDLFLYNQMCLMHMIIITNWLLVHLC